MCTRFTPSTWENCNIFKDVIKPKIDTKVHGKMTKTMFKKAGQRFWCILIFFKEEREAERLKEDIPELKANGGTTTFWDSE